MVDHDRPATKVKPKVAAAGVEAPSAEVSTPLGKSIFLFADGTGNSSAKLFKTNVWRMYEAIDFGLASPGKHVQIAYYDNGVGTSNFRPLALLGGIFGIGLKANVLRLYGFLCRNYQPNDRIYVFGFSRGAFTIRLLVGLIVSQGIIRTNGQAALSYQIRDAYRAFCADRWPNRQIARLFAWALRGIRDGVIYAKRRLLGQCLYKETPRWHTDVEFVGVWDTVAAYGGPIAEMTRGIDDWVWPLTMPHYGLSAKVRKARHALALDDERDAFQPLLWDEFREDLLIRNGEQVVVGQQDDGEEIKEIRKVSPGRLKQVWFTGVHSDVGGGYPDESLSYISLLWMMDELSPDPQNPAVDFIDSFVQRAKDLANPYGPIHDSRAGFGAYYRYQPRKIAALRDPPHVSTLSMRDPEVSRGLPEHGLLKQVLIHESVLARVMSGIDNYAPAALPAGFGIVSATGPNAVPCLTAQQHATLTSARPADALREDHQENAWNFVWRRRVLYFATVAVTLLLLALPVFEYLDWIEGLCSDDRCFADTMVDGGLAFVPESIRGMLHPWTQKPVLVMVLIIVIAVMIGFGKRYERRFRDKVRSIWRGYLAGALTAPARKTFTRPLRESAGYQVPFFVLKWWLLPAILGITIAVLIAYAAVTVVTQTLYAIVEPHDMFCVDRDDSEGRPNADAVPFATADSCTDLKVNVERGQEYELRLIVGEPWEDWNLPATPAGGVVDPPWYMRAMRPAARVVSANWLRPLTEVRTHEVGGGARGLLKPVIGPDIDIKKSSFRPTGNDREYSDLLCPRRNGHLYLMVNDTAPLLLPFNYWNNDGTAQVSVRRTGKACDPKRY